MKVQELQLRLDQEASKSKKLEMFKLVHFSLNVQTETDYLQQRKKSERDLKGMQRQLFDETTRKQQTEKTTQELEQELQELNAVLKLERKAKLDSDNARTNAENSLLTLRQQFVDMESEYKRKESMLKQLQTTFKEVKDQLEEEAKEKEDLEQEKEQLENEVESLKRQLNSEKYATVRTYSIIVIDCSEFRGAKQQITENLRKAELRITSLKSSLDAEKTMRESTDRVRRQCEVQLNDLIEKVKSKYARDSFKSNFTYVPVRS